MVSHELTDGHAGSSRRQARGCVIDRFIESVRALLQVGGEPLQVAARRLRPGGILQQWIPRAGATEISAAAQALGRAFAEVRVFPSVEDWGHHFLASNAPMNRYTAAQLADRVPSAAARDMLEWGPAKTTGEQFAKMVDAEMPVRSLIDADPSAPVLTDDRPVNEYYFLRWLFSTAD